MKKSAIITALMAAALTVAPLTNVMPAQAATTKIQWGTTVVDNLSIVTQSVTLDGQEWVNLALVHAQMFVKFVNLQYHLKPDYTGTITANGKTVNTRWGKTNGIVFVPLASVNSLFSSVNNSTKKTTTNVNVNNITSTTSTKVNNSNSTVTAAQAAQGLLSVYATQQVWPAGLILPGVPTSKNGEDWNGVVQPTPRSAWYGLKTVFPNQPTSSYAKLLGMTNAPSNKPITAGTLAQWLLNWELKARLPQSLLYEMKYQPSQNAYTLMSDYSMFWGTNFKNASSIVTGHDLAMVEKNIVSVDQAYRTLAPNKIELLRPFAMWPEHRKTGGAPAEIKGLIEQDNTIVTFGKNQFTVQPMVVNQPIWVNSAFYKSVNSGIDGSGVFATVTHVGQTVQGYAFIKGEQGYFQASMFQKSENALELPNSIGFNKPYVQFGINGVDFFEPIYYFGFKNGKIAVINVSGMKDNSWPIFSTSSFS